MELEKAQISMDDFKLISCKKLQKGEILHKKNEFTDVLKSKYSLQNKSITARINEVTEDTALEYIEKLGVKDTNIKNMLCFTQVTAIYDKDNARDVYVDSRNLEFRDVINQNYKLDKLYDHFEKNQKFDSLDQKNRFNEALPLLFFSDFIKKHGSLLVLRLRVVVFVTVKDTETKDYIKHTDDSSMLLTLKLDEL